MNNTVIKIPMPSNEPILSYAPGSAERSALKSKIQELKNNPAEVTPIVNGKAVHTGITEPILAPHNHQLQLGTLHNVNSSTVEDAISASMKARKDWANMHWTDRAAIFLKAADLLAGPYRTTINAATMLGQSKNAFQSEIDAACEIIDFLRFNAHYMQFIYEQQPYSPPGSWNMVQYRPLEGFVFAVAPFNFTAISGNLVASPAQMGNTLLWKPASTAVLSSYYLYKIFEEAGVPPGVMNFVPGHGATVGDPAFASEHFGGLHFTGSTGTFNYMWKHIGDNISKYRSYPRIVGETGGKDFVVAHPSAQPKAVATALVRGAFEYQGQKCSAASRAYIPSNLWDEIRDEVEVQLSEIKMGDIEDFSNFINAVIDKRAFDSITSYIDEAKESAEAKILFGGNYSDEVGYFIEPTVIQVENPKFKTMCEEIFGPVLTIYVYDETKFEETLELVNTTSPYALTGAIFSQDRRAIISAKNALEDAAGNFYINDKPTGAVVGQQPFGGARGSGTNDKAGSYLNLIRWISTRTIKETFVPPTHYGYPFLGK